MSTTTFHHDAGAQVSHDVPHAVAEFSADWFKATPAAILLRPAATFLTEWIEATPAAILARALRR